MDVRKAAGSTPSRTKAWNVGMTTRGDEQLDVQVPPGDIEGTVPDALRGGRLWSNGSGWTQIGGRLAHPFDGHGFLRSFELTPDGGLHLRGRFVMTESYEADRAAGRLVRRGFATNVGGWADLGVGGPVRNVANTTVYRWKDRVLAGWEGGVPHALDPDSIATRGEETFGGLLEGQATLAHMKHDPLLRRLVVGTVQQGRRTRVAFRELDADDRVARSTEAELPGMVFLHDFSMSERWYVLGGNRLRLQPWELAKMLVGRSTMLRSVALDERAPSELHLLPRDGGPLRTVTLPEPAWVVHFGNAFDDGDGLVVDACVFQRFTFGEEFGYAGPHQPLDLSLPESRGPQKLVRITVPHGSTTASWEVLTEHGVDFPSVDPAQVMQPAPWLFGATRRDPRFSDPFDSVLAVDLDDPERPTQLWTAPDDVFVGEPLFAAGEAGGHLLVILTDAPAGRTHLAIFDADDIASGPRARIPTPLLPIALHGCWDPSAGVTRRRTPA